VSPEFLEHRNDVLRRYAGLLAGVGATQRVPLTPLQLQVSAAALVSAADSILAAHVQSPDTVSVEDCQACLSYLLSRTAGVA
jgi:hypothetical protein